MALKAANAGPFTIPTAPSAGTATAQSSSANTYGSYVQNIASTAAALFITGVMVSASSTQVPTYVNVNIGTGAAASETTVGQIQIPVGFTAGAASSHVGYFVPIWPWIAVAVSTRIACKTASDVASAVSWNVSLQCVAQANVVDAGINEAGNVAQWNGTNVATPNTAGVPVVDQRSNFIRTGTVQTSGSNSTSAAVLDASASATDNFYAGYRITIISGTGSPQSSLITGYTGSTKVAALSPAWPTVTDNTSVFVISADAFADIESVAKSANSVGSGVAGQLTVDIGSMFGSSGPLTRLSDLGKSVARGVCGSSCTTTSLTTSSITFGGTSGVSYATNALVGMRVTFGEAAAAAQQGASALVTASTSGTTPTLTVSPALPAAPASGQQFFMQAGQADVKTVAATAQTARDLGAQLDATVSSRTKPADTQARVILVDTITTYTGDTPQTGDVYALANGTSGFVATKTDTAAIKAKTDNLPAAPASTTNITAGTITTVTNLTNAPTAGDLTATMKASVTVAVPTAAQNRAEMDSNSTKLAHLDADVSSRTKPADTQAAVTLVATVTNLTNAPTNGDLTSTMKTSVTTAATAATPIAASVTGAVGSVIGLTASDVGAIKAKTDNLPSDPADASDIAGAFTVVGSAIAGLNNISAAGVRAAVGLASANLDTQLDALPTNAELATALAGADDATLSAIAGLNNITAAAVRTEMDSNSTKLTAIKDKTDDLTFTVANQVDSNIKSVAGVTVNGDGTAGNPWGP